MVSEPTNFTVDSTTRKTADVSWTDNSTDEEGHRVYLFEDRYVTNFLEQDMGSWAHNFEGGRFFRTEEVWRRDRASGKKDVNNDPSGGFVILDSPTSRPFRLICALYRDSFDGGNYERVGVVDESGNGYDFRIARPNDEIGVGVRTGHSPNTIQVGNASFALGEWVYAELIVMSSEIHVSLYDSNRNLLGETTTTDTTHTGPFDRVHVYGGWPYYIDELRVEEAVQLEEVGANVESATVSPLKDGRYSSMYVEAFNDTNNDYAQSRADEGLTVHGNISNLSRASVIPDRFEVIPGWDSNFEDGGYLAEAYYNGELIGYTVVDDPDADRAVVEVDTDGRWYNVQAGRWSVDSHGNTLSTNIVSHLPRTLCRADFTVDGTVEVRMYKNDNNPDGHFTVMRNGRDLVELPNAVIYEDDGVEIGEEYEYRIRRFTEEEPQ